MYRLKPPVVQFMIFLAAGLVAFRSYLVVAELSSGDPSEALAFPLTVILPGLAFAFLALRRDMLSQEGALMQLGAMIQILLILALPRFGLHLALGFPIVFLIVEMFETRMPIMIKVRILHRLIA
jgi:hydrogenase-4 membrane subunit HyfE